MPDDIYAPPAMPFYIDRFIADTSDLSAEEIGGYVLLMSRQWTKGFIPSDAGSQARIVRLTPVRTRKLLQAIGSRLQPHPVIAEAVYSPFMEKVRAEMRERNKRASDRGKKGAHELWKRRGKVRGDPMLEQHASDAQAMLPACLPNGFQSPYSNLPDQLASLADSAREASTTAAATKSPAFAFCQWMLDEGLKRGVIGAHFAGDPFAWCYKQLGAAETLVNAYGEAECRARSERFFTASAGRRIRRIVNAISLLAVWDWDEIRTQTPPPEDEFIRELRAAEAH